MITMNRELIALEYEPAGIDITGWQEVQAACDRFLKARGIKSTGGWKGHDFLYAPRKRKGGRNHGE